MNAKEALDYIEKNPETMLIYKNGEHFVVEGYIEMKNCFAFGMGNKAEGHESCLINNK